MESDILLCGLCGVGFLNINVYVFGFKKLIYMRLNVLLKKWYVDVPIANAGQNMFIFCWWFKNNPIKVVLFNDQVLLTVRLNEQLAPL